MQPQPVAAPTATAAGPRDGEWSGRMLRQCTGFSDEGPASVNVSGNQHFDTANILASLPALQTGTTPNLREIARAQALVARAACRGGV